MKQGVLEYDVTEMAAALQIGENEVQPLFRDGRAAAGIMKRVACHLERGIMYHDQHPYAFIDKRGNNHGVRMLTVNGLDFAPSKMKGTGRGFHYGQFETYIHNAFAFYVFDVSRFPEVEFWKAPSRCIMQRYCTGTMHRGKMSRKQARGFLANLS